MYHKICNRLTLNYVKNFKQLGRYLTSDQNSLKKTNESETKPSILERIPGFEKKTEKAPRKGPFKYYFDDEERDKKKIVFYENFFDENTRVKDRKNFMSAIEAFRLTNPSKQLYIDFIYGALLKMKEYDAHTHLEAYRKLMELFPIGPLRSLNGWQRENMHFPRHQNCAIAILEQMERNGVIPDEEMGLMTVNIFGDWTHAVRKVKRQLYWLPKFKNLNPYALPSIADLEKISEFDLALFALKRMCVKVDPETKITAFYTKELENHTEDTWILSAQCTKQKELLDKHKKEIPLFVEGPNFTWVRSKLVNYYVLKTDPLDETKETLNEIEKYNEDDFKNIPNIFENPFKKSTKLKKKPNLSAHEQIDGIIYGVCCTGSNSKQSVIDWTKFLINTNPCLERYVIVYRIKDKPGFLAVINNNNNKNKEEKN